MENKFLDISGVLSILWFPKYFVRVGFESGSSYIKLYTQSCINQFWFKFGTTLRIGFDSVLWVLICCPALSFMTKKIIKIKFDQSKT